MMTDLVDENVGHDLVQQILAVAPEVEQRSAIEPDHVGQFTRLDDCAALSKPAALEEAQEVEFALGTHLLERLVVREIDDLDDETVSEPPE